MDFLFSSVSSILNAIIFFDETTGFVVEVSQRLSWAVVIFFVCGMLNGVMDTLDFHWHKSKFSKWFYDHSFFGPVSISYARKYVGNRPYGARKKIGIFNVPVFFTDAWHMSKSLFLWSMCISLLFVNDIVWYDVIIMRFVYGAGFVLMYDVLLTYKNRR